MESQEITLLELIIKIGYFFRRHIKGYIIAFVLAIILSIGYNNIKPKSYVNHFRIHSFLVPKNYIIDELSFITSDKQSIDFDSTTAFLNLTFTSPTPINVDSLIDLFDTTLNNNILTKQFLSRDYAETQLLVNKIEHLYNLNDSLFKISFKTTSSLYNFPSWIPISTMKIYSQKYYKLKHYDELSKILIEHTFSIVDSLSFIKIIVLSIFLVLFFATILFIIIDINHLVRNA